MLQNVRATAFNISKLLREIQQVGVKLLPPSPAPTHSPRLGNQRIEKQR